MPSHEETRERKRLLTEDLRRAYHDGQEGGDKALSQRVLSERYGLSMQTVGVELQKLVAEGVLYTIPRVGTFMGRSPARMSEIYLLLSHSERIGHELFNAVQTGFEERIALLGGASDALTVPEFLDQKTSGQPSTLAGQFFLDACQSPRFAELEETPVPHVVYLGSQMDKARYDTVDFDNEEGGEQATRHLLSVGHRRIAFLGLHGDVETKDNFMWSRQRESGWRRMMERAGQDTALLNFHPPVGEAYPPQAQKENSRRAAEVLLTDKSITAVIAVSVYALHGLLQALRDSQMPASEWPAIVCFDETPVSRASGVTYIRLPWEKLGAEAAQVLWERRTGRLSGSPQHRLVKMTLIPRLTCRPDWAANAAFPGDRLFSVISRPAGVKEAHEATVL